MGKKDTTGWVLPIEVGIPYKCIQIYIPNDVYDRGAFWGALFELTYSWNWQQNPPEKAREIANMWYQIWSDAYERSNGMNCCQDQVVLHRIDPETGRPQVSYDNGTTWREDPDDIQNQIVLQPPIVHDGSSSTKCDAATNCSEHVNELIAETGTNLSTASDVFTLAVGIAEAVLALFLILVSAGTLTAPVTAVATAIWAAATSLFALGIDAYNTYWTTDKKDAILCAIYCNIGENGQFTEAQYQAFRAKVKTTLPASPALDIVMTSINAGGATGLSQMASYGNAAEADCSSCVCGEHIRVYVSSGGGTEDSWDGEFLIATPVLGGDSLYHLFVQYSVPTSPLDNSACGKIDFISALSGEVTSYFYKPCGSDTFISTGITPVTDICACQWDFQSPLTFQLKISAKNCP